MAKAWISGEARAVEPDRDMPITFQHVMIILVLCFTYLGLSPIEEQHGPGGFQHGQGAGESVASAPPMGANGMQVPWRDVPEGRFPFLAIIKGRTTCLAALVDANYVLTAAHCIAEVGQHPIVAVQTISGKGTREIMEVRARKAVLHPSWTGQAENGYDVALLQLARPVNTSFPVAATQGFELYANFGVLGFRLASSNHLQFAQLQIIKNDLCPHLNLTGIDLFCAYSTWASMEP
eukprot:evm.model.scf_464.4 EVM.evm.TU.scf_464.4   scf_464:73157-76158(+)